MSRTIVVTSGKGGVGKTTLTANLGRVLAELGNRVVLLDTDFGLNNLDLLMNVENKIVYDLIDVIENRCRVKQAIIEDNYTRGLFVLPSNHSYESSKINGQNIKSVIKNLKLYFDYILVDCPAGIELGFHRAVSSCDEALVVSSPHISALRDASKVIKLLKTYQIKTDVVINRVRGDLILEDEMVGYEEIQQILGCLPIGMIPEDDSVNQLSNYRYEENRSSEGYRAIEMLAENVHYGKTEVYDATKKYKGFWGSIKRNLRKRV